MSSLQTLSEITMPQRTWWHRAAPHTRTELLIDLIVHIIGLVMAAVGGAILLLLTGLGTAPHAFPALVVYVSALLLVLSVSLAFNQWPVTPTKRLLARFDQAAIFLLIAATYTPILSLMWGTAAGTWLSVGVWTAACVGIGLKLVVPQHFGRLAIVLYLGIGFSGLLVFQGLADAVPTGALWLLVAGGLTYAAGIVFHLWEKLRFQNAIWHCFVVVGASLHMLAMYECLVFSRA
jgi:hemolysin III